MLCTCQICVALEGKYTRRQCAHAGVLGRSSNASGGSRADTPHAVNCASFTSAPGARASASPDTVATTSTVHMLKPGYSGSLLRSPFSHTLTQFGIVSRDIGPKNLSNSAFDFRSILYTLKISTTPHPTHPYAASLRVVCNIPTDLLAELCRRSSTV